MTTLTQPKGLTLIELLAASVVGVVIVLALGQVDVARVKFFEALPRGQGQRVSLAPEATYALDQMLSDLKQADRVVLRSLQDIDLTSVTDWVASDVQAYLPASEEWVEYRFKKAQETTPASIEMFRSTCAAHESFQAPGMSDLYVQFVDIAGAPPGGEPFGDGRDNNVVAVGVLTKQKDEGGKVVSQRAQYGSTIPLAMAYTNLGAVFTPDLPGGIIDSGAGLSRSSAEVTPCPAT
jgi:Tfp pilus assembly protein PilV